MNHSALALLLIASLAACTASTGEEVSSASSDLTDNAAMRGEIARALADRQLAPEEVRRIVASAGPRVDPDEIGLAERLLLRVYTDEIRIEGLDRWLLGSLVAQGLAGDPGSRITGAYIPQPPRVPTEGTPLTKEVVATFLGASRLTSLRADLLLYAAHVRIFFFISDPTYRWTPPADLAVHPIWSRGTLVHDTSTGNWLHGEPINLSGYEDLSVVGNALVGNTGYPDHAPVSIDLTQLALSPVP
ncbi:MAG TPA: hypothetical protein VM925_03215 [Labilithrix sp.]|nr:hypothetical protein [Labilithrix sp.]